MKRLFVIFVLVLAVLLTACSLQENNKNEQDPSVAVIETPTDEKQDEQNIPDDKQSAEDQSLTDNEPDSVTETDEEPDDTSTDTPSDNPSGNEQSHVDDSGNDSTDNEQSDLWSSRNVKI